MSFKKVTYFVFLLSAVFAGSFSQAETQTNCSEVFEQLKVKIELTQQLGNAYLQTFQTLNDVYSTWGDRLSKTTDLKEPIATGKFFLQSAKAFEAALPQSQKTVDDLKAETDKLLLSLKSCLR